MNIAPSDVDFEAFHRSLFVLDGLHSAAWNHNYMETLRKAGIKAIHRSFEGIQEFESTIQVIEQTTQFLENESDTLSLVSSAGEIEAANRRGHIAVVFGLQGADPLGGDWRLLEAFKRLGVQIIQLTYNRRNWLGDGCTERTDCGLSDLGVRIIQETNRLRMIVDCAHTGENSVLDAIEVSNAPVIISHANVRALCDNPRNVSDRVIKAVAVKGGVIGLTSFAYFLSKTRPATVSNFLDHVDYICKLVGADHVGLGLDIIEGWDQTQLEPLDRTLYKTEAYPPLPWTYAAGLSSESDIPAITKGLLDRHYDEGDIRKIMGLNWLRAYREIWGQ